MFGTVMTAHKALSEEEKARYEECYCGVCRALRKGYGTVAKLTLNYDVAFLCYVLGAYFGTEGREEKPCAVRFFKKTASVCGEIADYCADMNILLSYYGMKDNAEDDGSVIASVGASFFKKSYEIVKEKYPEKCAVIEEQMNILSQNEKKDLIAPDLMGDVFGKILGEIFVYKDDRSLYSFGAALGKFIYLNDACIDLKKDLKKGRYNPLVMTDSKDFDMILESLGAALARELEAFDGLFCDPIIKNVVYMGIYTKYEMMKARSKK